MAATAAELSKLVDTVLAAAKKAEGGDAAEQGRTVDGLKVLKKQRVSTKVLAETQAGKRVKGLTKHPQADVAAAAGEVVAAWKEVVRRESQGSAAPSGSAASAPSSSKPAAGGAGGAAGLSRAASQSTVDGGAPSSQATAGGSSQPAAGGPPLDVGAVPRCGDTLRDKCRQNLAAALNLALGEGSEGDPIACGVAVEGAIFKQADCQMSQAYKAKFRNLHFNLKDAANPDLRRKVLAGDIQPDTLVLLAPEDLASDVKKGENQRIREKKLFDSAPSAAKQATTDQFQCGKCRQRKTTYYQMQTRSADEPMTTFVTCLNCNNRWKFC
ncbi:Transcription elongation factor A 2 [Micractinium conductrix]|uniref:Transcription elongation factor n=1 Tax=Micractinium conductrix TaxID=554055 RepID=A0A2P6VNR6_9CHLO|nr:Transcription elongation factor A 2 [Micractinium conductrix]|eukprot:PSC75709.1 Transcription elongation factor A 2 [Micractinium conductrix]